MSKEQVKKVKNPNGKIIYFTETDHKYYDDDGNNYISATSIVESLFPEFEKDKIAFFSARKRLFEEGTWTSKQNIPKNKIEKVKKIILDEWKEKGEEAASLGTDIHKLAECLLKREEYDIEIDSTRKEKMIQSLKKFIPELLEHYEFLEAEKIIFSPFYQISGTIDLLMKNRYNNKLCIFDWKTNKSIKKSSSYDKKGKLFLSEFDDCNYWKYCLQLNVYKWILLFEKYGDFQNSELGLFHINTRNVTPIRVPHLDMYKEAFFDYIDNLRS